MVKSLPKALVRCEHILIRYKHAHKNTFAYTKLERRNVSLRSDCLSPTTGARDQRHCPSARCSVTDKILDRIENSSFSS